MFQDFAILSKGNELNFVDFFIDHNSVFIINIIILRVYKKTRVFEWSVFKIENQSMENFWIM